ncbi:MAG: hypothetical protein NVSMB9_20550 [Isosphaeraceae bacterium]
MVSGEGVAGINEEEDRLVETTFAVRRATVDEAGLASGFQGSPGQNQTLAGGGDGNGDLAWCNLCKNFECGGVAGLSSSLSLGPRCESEGSGMPMFESGVTIQAKGWALERQG